MSEGRKQAMIKWKLGHVLLDRQMTCVELSKIVGLNVQVVRRHRAKQNFEGMRVEMLERYCEALNCQPGDLLERV